MSYVFNMVGGGGGSGGLSPNSAVIHVTAPAGSTISFEKGGVVAKVLGPDKSHVNADDNTLADWYYAIASTNYGSWTVTAARGSDMESKTVTVSMNKQYDVKLDFGLYIIRNGQIERTMTLINGTLTAGTTHAAFSSNGNVAALAKLEIDITGRSALHIRLETGGTSWFKNQTPGIGFSATNPSIGANSCAVGPYVAYKKCDGRSGEGAASVTAGDYSVDLSSSSGYKYVWAAVSGYTGSSGLFRIKDFYLS